MDEIYAVVVTYNRKQLLKECINALKSQSRRIEKILVVNNNSDDGTTEFLTQFQSDNQFVICNLNKNVGGAAGFSYGVKRAYELGAGYVWIMDDDTIPDSGALNALMDKSNLLNNNYGFLCSNVRWTDGEPTNIPSPDTKWPSKINQNLIQIKTATFVSVLVPRRIIGKLGLPTAKLFIWGDDTEYTTRISSQISSYFVIDSTVLHKSKTNLSNTNIINDMEKKRLPRYFYMYRNLVYIARKYNGNKEVLKTCVSALIYGVKALFFAKNLKFKRFGIVIRGIFSGLFFNPKIIFPNQMGK